MGRCSKTNFLQGHYNIVKVVNNNSVIFTRFSYWVIVYICLKVFNFCSIKHKTRHIRTLIFWSIFGGKCFGLHLILSSYKFSWVWYRCTKLGLRQFFSKDMNQLSCRKLTLYEKISTTQNPIQVRMMIHKVTKKRIVVT